MKIRRVLRRIFGFALFAYIVWIGFRALTFKRYGEPDRKGKIASGPSSADTDSPRVFEMEGVYHLHSLFSDGRRSIDSIAGIAAAQGLDFLVLTDHGNPNAEALGAQGRIDGVLVLAGTEISSSRGHLVALGFDPIGPAFDRDAEMAAREVEARGGFTVIAHPYSKTRWSWGKWAGYSGLEILNGDTEVKRNLALTIVSAPLLLLRPEAALLSLLGPPERELRAWDRMAASNPTHHVSGYYAADAHFGYGPLFRFFHIHALLDTPPEADFAAARGQVFAALRAGLFYSAVEAAAEADGFRFWAERSGIILPMGSSIKGQACGQPLARGLYPRASTAEVDPRAKPALIASRMRTAEPGAPAAVETGGTGAGAVRFKVRAPFEFNHEARLVRDGQVVARSASGSLAFDSAEPGVYRVEVFLRERSPLGPDVPWIASNPIVIQKEKP
jgi:hypothetical protein